MKPITLAEVNAALRARNLDDLCYYESAEEEYVAGLAMALRSRGGFGLVDKVEALITWPRKGTRVGVAIAQINRALAEIPDYDPIPLETIPEPEGVEA